MRFKAFLMVLLLATLAFLQVSVAATLDKRDLVSITPDMSTTYPIPLQIVLTQDNLIPTKFEAEVFNHNAKTIKLLKFGTFLHNDDVAVKSANIFLNGKPVQFLGVTPRLNFHKLGRGQFITIKTGKSIKVQFNVAEYFDLSDGEDFTIQMKGSLPIAELKSTRPVGYSSGTPFGVHF